MGVVFCIDDLMNHQTEARDAKRQQEAEALDRILLGVNRISDAAVRIGVVLDRQNASLQTATGASTKAIKTVRKTNKATAKELNR